MKYRISVQLNRIPDSYNIMDSFNKAKAYHAKYGVDITFDFQNTDIHGYTSTFNAYLNRWLLADVEKLVIKDPTANVNMFVFDQAEWSTPIGSQFPLQPNTPNGYCTNDMGKPFITIGAYTNQDMNWVQIAHEIMHSYVQTAKAKGIIVEDVMDTYIDNQNPDSITGNFAQEWYLLKNYLDKQIMKTVTIERIYNWGSETVGHLTTDGFECRTLELGWKNNASNISSIPVGTYQVKWSFMPSHLTYHYQVMNVPGRSGIFIHAGNYFWDSKGCIILGQNYGDINKDKVPDLLNSGVVLSDFEKFMGKQDFTLIIK